MLLRLSLTPLFSPARQFRLFSTKTHKPPWAIRWQLTSYMYHVPSLGDNQTVINMMKRPTTRTLQVAGLFCNFVLDIYMSHKIAGVKKKFRNFAKNVIPCGNGSFEQQFDVVNGRHQTASFASPSALVAGQWKKSNNQRYIAFTVARTARDGRITKNSSHQRIRPRRSRRKWPAKSVNYSGPGLKRAIEVLWSA